MSVVSLLRRLGEVRAVVVTSSGNLATSLAALSLANLWRSEKPERIALIELSPLHRPTVERALELQGVSAELVFLGPEESPGMAPAVVAGVGVDRSVVEEAYRLLGRAGRVWIVPANWGLSIKLRYPVIRLSTLPTGEVLARLGREGGSRVRVTPYGVEEAPPPRGEARLRALREMLAEVMVEHGHLTIRDAVNAIMAREGVDRRQARELFMEMARRGLIRVRKGAVEL